MQIFACTFAAAALVSTHAQKQRAVPETTTEHHAMGADDECAVGGCTLNALQLKVWASSSNGDTSEKQMPSGVDQDFQNAEQGLSGLPSNIAGEVGGDLSEAMKDYHDALQHQKQAQADQAKLEDIYSQTRAEEAEWNKQEASWTPAPPLPSMGAAGDYGSYGVSALQVSTEGASAKQMPSGVDQDFQNAEQGLSGLPSNVAGEVGGDLNEAMKDYHDAQQHQKQFNADQAKLEDIYSQTRAEEAKMSKEEASWTPAPPLPPLPSMGAAGGGYSGNYGMSAPQEAWNAPGMGVNSGLSGAGNLGYGANADSLYR